MMKVAIGLKDASLVKINEIADSYERLNFLEEKSPEMKPLLIVGKQTSNQTIALLIPKNKQSIWSQAHYSM
jgi:hypothetical protein